MTKPFQKSPSSLENLQIGFSDIVPLKKEIRLAEKEQRKTFTYKGESVLVAYANYLVEYLEGLAKEYQ
jgi:hypothetical protein